MLGYYLYESEIYTMSGDFSIFEYEKYKDGYRILGIDEDMWADNHYELRIPEGTVAIAEDAFMGEKVTTVHFPHSIREIEDYAFSECHWLEYISFPSDCQLKKIGEYAFDETLIKHLTLPRSLERIEDRAFENCTALKTVNFAAIKSLKSIGSEAFSGCTSLEIVSLPDGLQSIDSEAFSGCTSLSFVGIPSSVKEMSYDVFAGCNALGQLNLDFDAIPDTWDEDFLADCNAAVKLLGNSGGYTPMSKLILEPYTYEEGKYTLVAPAEWGIEHLNLHPDIVNIAPKAFYENLKLKSFKANCPRIIICEEAFANCQYLTEIDFKDAYIGKEAFKWTGIKRAIFANVRNYGIYRESCVEEFYTPEWCKDDFIPSYTFMNTRIKELKIPEQIKRLGHHAFSDCVLLEKLDLGSVEGVSERAFQECSSLKKIIFPKNDVTVWDYAFKDCRALESVEIPANVRLSRGVFSYCTSLREVIIHGTDIPVYEETFEQCPIKRLVIKNVRSTDGEKRIDFTIKNLALKHNESIEIVYKDKTVIKTKKADGLWI